MSEIITLTERLIQSVGFPIAAFIMVWKWATGEVTKRLDRIETKLDAHIAAQGGS